MNGRSKQVFWGTCSAINLILKKFIVHCNLSFYQYFYLFIYRFSDSPLLKLIEFIKSFISYFIKIKIKIRL